MWLGLLRFTSLLFPKSWTEFIVANRITDFNKPFVLSQAEIDKDEERRKEKQGIEEVSQTEQEIQEKLQKSDAALKGLLKSIWDRPKSNKPWREVKKQWEYFYLKDIKNWRLRGTLENEDSNIYKYSKDLMYFPEWNKFKLNYKRLNKFMDEKKKDIIKTIGDKIIAQTVFKCPPITESQAYMILNLEPPAEGYPELDVIYERFETLSNKNCPTQDSSGSIYIGSKIDSAKDYFMQKIPGGKQYDLQKIKDSGLEQQIKRIQKEEEQQTPDWMIEEQLVEESQQEESAHFEKQVSEGLYTMPKWLLYRYYKVKQLDILFYLQQKKIAQEEKKLLLERKRKEKQIRMQIQQLQDKVDKIVAQGGDASGIVFPEMPPEEPSKIEHVVTQSEQELNKKLQNIRNFMKVNFTAYELQAFKHMIDPQIEEQDFELELQYDYDDETQKMLLIAKML